MFTNAWYSLVAKLDNHGQETFMNYGYAELDGAAPPLPARFDVHRYAVQLYRHVVSRAELRGKDVLEIGCGRGGGASYVAAESARAVTSASTSTRRRSPSTAGITAISPTSHS